MEKIIQNVFSRMGMADIEFLLTSPVMDILRIEESEPDKKKLAQIFLDIFGTDHLLEIKDNLKHFISFLDEATATSLAEKIGSFDSTVDPWSHLNDAPLGLRRSKEIIRNFFGWSETLTNNQPVQASAKSIELVDAEYPLFAHQEKAANNIKTLLASHDSVLLHMPTGAGKTRTAINFLTDFLRNVPTSPQDSVVVWLADTEELCQQAADEFKKAWSVLGSRQVAMHLLFGSRGGSLDEIANGVLIASPQMLNSRYALDQQGKLSLSRRVSLVIFDEAHRVIAPTYSHIVDNFQTLGRAKLVGLSATPGRSTLDENENRKFAEYFGGHKVSLEIEGFTSPVKYLQSEGYLAEVNYVSIPHKGEDLDRKLSKLEFLDESSEINPKILQMLGDDGKRNILILNHVIREIDVGSKIILFACSVPHAESLFALLTYKGIRAGLVSSRTKKETRRKTIQDYKNQDLDVLVNFGVLTTGFDAPHTNVAVIARPTNSLSLYSQMVGRATRGPRAGGNKSCKIYTVIDEELNSFRDLSLAFKHWDGSWKE
jgi:superfamily II DNA or RNA helicase